MAEIEKGYISTIEGTPDGNGNATRARVIPAQADAIVTRPLTIPWYLRGKMGNLQKGTEVVFAVFPDNTGIVIARSDGEWGGTVPGNVTVGGKATASDFKTSQVTSYNSHTHGGVESGGSDTGTPK